MRILVVQVAGIGDAVMASTIATRVRAEYPGADLTWMCSRAAEPVVALYEGVSRVIAIDQRALFRGGPIARMRAILGAWLATATKRFDRVLLVHVDPRFRVLILPLVGARVSTLSRSRHGEMIPIPGRYLGDEYARLLGTTEHVGPIERRFDIADLRPRLNVPIEPRRVVMVPGGARNALREDSLRRWPVEHYAEVARRLVAANYDVVLIGNADDAWVRPAFAGVSVTDRIGRGTLIDSLRLIASAELVISHDTGPMHLARAVRAPLVAIFGPTSPSQFLSPDDSVTVLWGGADLACRPCYDGRELARCAANICLSRVSPATVFDAAIARLQGNAVEAGVD